MECAGADADGQFYYQNVMCMRSGLVIKTAPVGRSTVSARFQSDSQTRGPRDPACVPAGHSLSPAAPQQPAAADASGADSCEAAAGGGSTKTGGRVAGGGVARPRSLDFLSIVTRFQLARRARAVELGIDTADNSWRDDEDWINSAVELDFITDDSIRSLCAVGVYYNCWPN